MPTPKFFQPNWLPTTKQNDRHYNRYLRDKISQKFYTSQAWQATRLVALKAKPLCACGEPATQVHHKNPIRQSDPDTWLDLDGLETCCAPCHNRKRTKER